MHIDFSNSTLKKLLHLLEVNGWMEMDEFDMEAIAHRANCQFFHGVSKGCFLADGWDFVIKIPYYGCKASKNYCDLEYKSYENIKRNYSACADLFAEIKYLGTYGEIPVYAQERVFLSVDEMFWEMGYRHYSDELKKYSNSLMYSLDNFHRDYTRIVNSRLCVAFCGAIVRTYGYAIFKALCRWIVNTEQTDLHSSNVGFTDDLRPIIFDYSGWDDFDSDSDSWDSESAS